MCKSINIAKPVLGIKETSYILKKFHRNEMFVWNKTKPFGLIYADIKCESFYFNISLISIFLTPLNVNFIFEGFLVVVSTGIETPLEFLFSSFLSITVEVAVVLLVVVICVVLVGAISWVVVGAAVLGLLKTVKGVTLGLVNVGWDIGVTGKGFDLGVTGFRFLKLFGRIWLNVGCFLLDTSCPKEPLIDLIGTKSGCVSPVVNTEAPPPPPPWFVDSWAPKLFRSASNWLSDCSSILRAFWQKASQSPREASHLYFNIFLRDQQCIKDIYKILIFKVI